MSDNYRRVTYTKINSLSIQSSDELTDDMKSDLQLAFDLYKNESNLINKLRLRTILYSFAMYKSSPKQINDYIAEVFPKQEEFTLQDLYKLILFKVKNIKEIETESLFNFINVGKTNTVSKSEISAAFNANGIEISDKEVFEMMAFMTGLNDQDFEETTVTKEEFKKFLI